IDNEPYDPKAPKIETPAECTVKIIGEELVHSVIKFKLKQYINDHHVLTVHLRQDVVGDDDIGDPDKFTKFLGESISVEITPMSDEVDVSAHLEFIGVVTEVRFENSVDEVNILVITAKSPTISMDGPKKNLLTTDQSVSDIVGSVLSNYQITQGTIDSTPGILKYSVQYRETDYAYIQRLASSAGKFAFYDGTEFRFVSASSTDEHELMWRELLGSFSLGLGTVSCNFQGASYNYFDDSEHSDETAQSNSKTSLSGLTDKSFTASEEIFNEAGYWNDVQVVDDTKGLVDALENEKARAMGKMVIGTGQSIVPNVTVGHCVKIEGMDKFNQQLWVTEVVHILDKTGKYHNKFKCVPLDIAYPTNESALTRTLARIQRAVVIDNNDDDAMGRLKVKFPWSDMETIWVRYLAPHAGEDRGFFCLPEIGDEVLVAFEEGDPDRPIVIGSLYNKNTPVPEVADPDNYNKIFKTMGGNQIVFYDEGGAEKIEISHGDGTNSIVLSMDGPSITITSSGGDITLESNNITLKADSAITLESGSDLKVDAGANMELTAGATSKIEASATMDIKGATINLN
ncbi:MAG: type VI secretion system tip protein VgrG, partial [candidate division Zixibacteria bacterium]|nr:type VI secretion system tip protein VgrG [candidate division Zixibacteria bacterium]